MKFYTKKKYKDKQTEHTEYYLFNKILCLKKEITFDTKKIFLFNSCIHKKQLLNKKLTNVYDIKQIFTAKDNLSSTKADIIIPVYNGYEYLNGLFLSIKENTDIDYNLIVINDCSTDKQVEYFLGEMKEKFGSKMLLLENEQNLGFVKSVNKALKFSKENVILLNTDVILPSNWAKRLLYPILANNKVASVTPFSNSATIFSLPLNNTDNLFEGDLERVNQNISCLNIPHLEFTTGVGFCMAMNRKTIKEIGYFDEIFEKGYGEEVDWCQRAIANGYINTIAADLFVWHKHGGSFNKSVKQKAVEKHSKIINTRYPKFSKNTSKLITGSYYKSLRFWAELLYLKSFSAKTYFWFDHTWHGGTETYTFNQIEKLKNDNLIIRIQNEGSNYYTLSYYHKEFSAILKIDGLNNIKELANKLLPDEIIINNLASYVDVISVLKLIENLKTEINTKLSLRVHDFQCLCPTITMTDFNNKYCNCISKQNCPNCYEKIPLPLIKVDSIQVWQNEWGNFLEKIVDELIFFSQSSMDIYLNFYPNIKHKSVIIPHTPPSIRKVQIPKHKTINIGVLGNINIIKGSLILKEADKLLNKYPNVKLKIIGDCNIKKFHNIKVLGQYKIQNLPNIIERNEIDLIFIPSVCPETFSYTTAEAMEMGLPVACFNIGAPAERIKKSQNGIVISEINAHTALEEIIKYIKNKD